MQTIASKIGDRIKSVNYFSVILIVCQMVILLMSSCTVYKKQLHNRFAIGIGLYETRVRVHHRDLLHSSIVLLLHLLSHLNPRLSHLPSLPYPAYLGRGLYTRYAPFLLQCFSILKNDTHLKHVIYFKLTTLLYVLFGCVQAFVAANVLFSVYEACRPAVGLRPKKLE